MTVYHISGHLDLVTDEFMTHYHEPLKAAVAEGASFVVGDAKGADALAQAWLGLHDVEVCVFHMMVRPRHNIGNFPTRFGYQSDEERDAAMTAASDADIAWVRPGREKSGTAKNLARRARWKVRDVMTSMFRDGVVEAEIIKEASRLIQEVRMTGLWWVHLDLQLVEDARVIAIMEGAVLAP